MKILTNEEFKENISSFFSHAENRQDVNIWRHPDYKMGWQMWVYDSWIIYAHPQLEMVTINFSGSRMAYSHPLAVGFVKALYILQQNNSLLELDDLFVRCGQCKRVISTFDYCESDRDCVFCRSEAYDVW